MRRRLLAILSVLSLMLCLVTAGMWIRSYTRFEAIYFNKVIGTEDRPQRRFFHARSSLGSISLCYVYENCLRQFINPYDLAVMGQGWIVTRERRPPEPLNLDGGLIGFQRRFETELDPSLTRYRQIIILPYWFPSAVFAVLPMLWCHIWLRQHRRLKNHLCLTCGYDLRASKDRCPECGTAIPLNAASCPQSRNA